MRIDLVARRLGAGAGSEGVGLGLARHLLEAGDRVVAHCLEPGEAVPGLEQRRLPGPPVRGRVARQLRLAWAARALPPQPEVLRLGLIRGAGFDLWRAGGGCHAAWLAASNRRMDIAERIELSIDRKSAQSARLVVVNSEMAGRSLQEHYGVSQDRIRLVRNGVDLARFRPAPGRSRPGPHARLLFLGHGWARKGLSTALAAVARLPRAQLTVMGSERRPARWKAEAVALGIADRVRFLGPCSDPAGALVAHDALLHPTRYDSAANVCLEALACGLPVLTSALDGASEILPERAWVVADPTDAAAFAEAVERALQSGGHGASARAAAEGWSAHSSFERMRSILTELSP